MHLIDWLIVLIPLAGVLYLAIRCGRYVRGVADFLAAGRVAGRYVISVGDLQSMLSVITLIALCEQEYLCGMAVGFWAKISIPIGIFMSLTGYVLYRYRETKSLSMGQFLENRYNRPLRIVAASIRTIAEMMTNAIGPAVAARFFIYFMGFPPAFDLFGFQVSTYALFVLLLLVMALAVIWPGGRISLLVTDSLQGLMSYPIFVIFSCFVLSEISWSVDAVPVMIDRAPGESFLNPMDIHNLREFNIFALLVTMFGNIINRGAWIGNDSSACGRTAHEQKMAGVLGAWRNGFAWMMMTLLALFLITIMHADAFKNDARAIRTSLVTRVSAETVSDPALREQILADIRAIPAQDHRPGVTPKLAKNQNPDLLYLNHVKNHLNQAADREIAAAKLAPDSPGAAALRGEQNANFQKFRTLYYQMMTPTLLRKYFPVGLAGAFMLLMLMLMLASDDSRIFNASATLVQDVVMPFRKKPFATREHLTWLRVMSVAVAAFFFAVSLCFSQLDYINMFINIMCSLWLGAAGPIMLGGLYTRWGTTSGAFAALLFGSGTAIGGLFCQRNWADLIYPFLESSGYLGYLDTVFRTVSGFTAPYVVWEMNAQKFPVNSYEIYFLATVLGIAGYTIVSLLTCKQPYDLEKLLHRGRYAETAVAPEPAWTWRNVYGKLIGITGEYTTGDKVIAWSVFGYAIVYQFVLSFLAVLIWNLVSPWPAAWWSTYFFITVIVVGIIVGAVSTVWFMWGGILDLKRLFKDLATRPEDPADDGWVNKK